MHGVESQRPTRSLTLGELTVRFYVGRPGVSEALAAPKINAHAQKVAANHNAMIGWPSAKIRRTIAATAASADATKASLPTSSILPRGKAGLVVRRNLSASAIFFFPCRPLASGSRVNRSAYTTRNLCVTENAQQASRFPPRSRGRRSAQEHDR